MVELGLSVYAGGGGSVTGFFVESENHEENMIHRSRSDILKVACVESLGIKLGAIVGRQRLSMLLLLVFVRCIKYGKTSS